MARRRNTLLQPSLVVLNQLWRLAKALRTTPSSFLAIAPGALPVALVLGLVPARASADGQSYHEKVEVQSQAPTFTFPVEAGHAAAWVADRVGPIYKWNATALPGFWIHERVTLHAALQVLYRNPYWDFGAGGRATVLLARGAAGLVVTQLFAEGSYLVRDHAARIVVGPLFGLGRLFYLSGGLGWESDRNEWSANLGVGIDILALSDPVGAAIHYVPPRDLSDGCH